MPDPLTTDHARPTLRPWSFVVAFGVVSLLADMVYEGARSIIGPYLATLGASATVVGLVAGAGEFIGYGLRVFTGYAVARSRRYWPWTILGYALTVLSVPLIGATGAMVPALLLYGSERLGKAVRAPAKDTLLSHASSATGRGKAFGVHQAMDQTGAILGPLLLAAVLSLHEGDYRLAFGVLAVPGVAVLAVLLWLRARVPDPLAYEEPEGGTKLPSTPDLTQSLPARFWWYVGTVAVISCGVASFPLLAFHATHVGLLSDAMIPILFAVAMAVDGLTGLVIGQLYDRRGPVVLLLVPIAGGAAVIAFGLHAWMIWAGVAVWGVVNGVLDSTVKAVVTELVLPARRAVAFGWLALVRGLGLLIAGGVLGWAYDGSRVLAQVLIVAVNALAFVALLVVLPRRTVHK
ncbi:MFS transporter [Nocardioides montaniterrae]